MGKSNASRTAVSAGRKRKASSSADRKSAKKTKPTDKKGKSKPKSTTKAVKESELQKIKSTAPAKQAKSSTKSSGKDAPSTYEQDIRTKEGYTAAMPTRNSKGELIFDDCPRIRPNMTPKEVLQAGSFGGTYFRPIKSGVTGKAKKKIVFPDRPKNTKI